MLWPKLRRLFHRRRPPAPTLLIGPATVYPHRAGAYSTRPTPGTTARRCDR